VPILMSKDTYLLARDHVAARFIDRVRVVGRNQPVDLYEPLVERQDISDEMQQECRFYEKGWSLMKQGQYAESLKVMEKLHALRPNDGLYEVMMNRLKAYVQTPPPLSWDGVYSLKSK